LTVGRDCLAEEEEGGKRQLFISYGKKSDDELLINYGFLPGVRGAQDGDKRDVKRRCLAQAFLERNNS